MAAAKKAATPPTPEERKANHSTALKLVAMALRSPEEPEALAHFRKARKLIAKHGFDLIAEASAARGMDTSVAAAMTAAAKVREAARTVQDVARDPDVMAFVGSLGTLFKAGSGLVGKVKGR